MSAALWTSADAAKATGGRVTGPFAAGKTRFIGYSGDGQDAVYAIETGVFDTLQTSVSVADLDKAAVERSLALIETVDSLRDVGELMRTLATNGAGAERQSR